MSLYPFIVNAHPKSFPKEPISDLIVIKFSPAIPMIRRTRAGYIVSTIPICTIDVITGRVLTSARAAASTITPHCVTVHEQHTHTTGTLPKANAMRNLHYFASAALASPRATPDAQRVPNVKNECTGR